MIRLTIPPVGEAEIEAAADVLRTGQLVQGARVAALEARVAALGGTTDAVVVSSGTAALHLALLALGVGPGMKVAVPAYSFIATANVVELCGATPVFVDIDIDSYGMSAAGLSDVVAREDLAAVMPVHPFGQVADMAGLISAAGDVPIVEDAAAGLGATLDGRPAGSFGAFGCFSFHPRKSITTGEGGAISTNDAAAARLLRALRNHGQDPDAATVEFFVPGFNYRMTEFQAAIGLSQLERFEELNVARAAAAARYDVLLAGTPVRPPVTCPGSRPVHQSYVTMLPEGADRAEIIRRMREDGIETQIGTWHMPLARYYRERYGYRPGDFPVTDAVFERSLTLPLYPRMREEDQARVVGRLLELL